MSTYTVTGSGSLISVKCDGAPIEMIPLISAVEPLYAYGEKSDGSMNMAHTILLHCCGRHAAEQLCQEFVGKFLLNHTTTPFKIEAESIRDLVLQTSSYQIKAQQLIQNSTRI